MSIENKHKAVIDKLYLDVYTISNNMEALRELKKSIMKLEECITKQDEIDIVDEELMMVKVAIGKLVLKMNERGFKV